MEVLTLSVQRYFVPKPSTRGEGEVSRPSMFPKTVRSANLKFGGPIGLSLKVKTNVKVDDVSFVRF